MAGPTVAPMGYIGGVQIGNLPLLRVTSCSLAPKQAINHPDVVDGNPDWTLYQLAGIEIDGDIAVPVVAGDFITTLFNTATSRSPDGELNTQIDPIVVQYGKQAGRTFQGCLINSLDVKATAGERIDATVNVWATTFTEGGQVAGVTDGPFRVLCWSDVQLTGVDGCQVREFSWTIANNLQRNYTFCESSVGGHSETPNYFPSNISTGKRHISGSLTFQGFAPTDGLYLQAQRSSPTPPDTAGLGFAFSTGFAVTFNNIVWEYQTIEAQAATITSSCNWYAHGGSGQAAFQ